MADDEEVPVYRPQRVNRSNSINGHTAGFAGDLFTKFTDLASNAVHIATTMTQKGVSMAGGVMHSTADAVGLKDKLEGAENMARKLAQRSRNDAGKAVSKAKRLASRAFEINAEGDDVVMHTYDYELLLSTPGAMEKKIAPLGHHSPSFSLPPNQSLVYKIRVKKWDIGFSIRDITNPNHVHHHTETASNNRFGADVMISGRIEAIGGHPRMINFHFDNSYSPLQSKMIVYWISIGENVTLEDSELQNSTRNKEMQAAEEGPLLD